MGTFIGFQTIIVYSFIGLSMYTACNLGSRYKKWSYVVIGLSIYALLFGLRYGVGRDYFSYVDDYIDFSRQGYTDRDLETGFTTVIKIFTSLGLPIWFFFSVMAFLQIFFVFKAFRDERYIWPLMSLVFVLNCEWLSYANVIRQSLSFAFFAYSISLAEKRKIILHYVFIILAISVHASSIVFLVIYPLFQIRKELFKNIPIELGLFFLALFLGLNDFVQSIMKYLEILLTQTRYYSYLYSSYAEHLDRELSIGTGYIIGAVINLFLIIKSNKVKMYIKSDKLTFIYDLYFGGTILFYMFFSSRVIQRMSLYFYGFAFIVGAFTLYYLSSKKKVLQFSLLMFLYLLIFAGYMYKMDVNDVAFRFIWQKNL